MRSTLCAILLLASPAFATIAQQRAASKWTCSGTVTGGILQCYQSFTTTGSNDLIAVWTTWQSSVTLTASVSDTLTSIRYTSAVGPTQQPTQASGVPANAQIFYLKSTGSGGADTVTVTLTGPSGTSVPSFGMVMAEYSGLDTVAPLDSVSEAISNSGSPSGTLDSGTASPANANLLVFGGGNSDNGSATTGLPWTTIQSNGGNITEYQILSGNNTLQRATAGISPSPTTGNWLMQMAIFRGASWTIAEGSSPTRTHHVLDASQFPGSDIGAQINNAYASCPAAGCHIRVDAGNYNFSTAINFATNNKAVELDCDSGAYGSTSAVTQLIYSGTGPAVQFQNGTAQGRALTGCALVGPGRSTSTIGLLVGGCPNLASYPTIDFCTYTGNGSLTGAEFSNFDISGFGLGVMLGNNFYLSAFRNGRVHDNGPAGSVAQNPQNLVYPAAAVSSGETISFYNVHFIQSTANAGVSSLCVDFEGSTAVEMSFDTSSFDNCPIALNGSTLSNSFMRLFKGQDSSRADGSRRGGELVAGQVAERGWSTRPAASFDSSTYATVASNLRPMFTSQREKWAEPHIIAVVELDMQKMRVRFVLAREAIRERMRELERPKDHYGERQGIEDTSG